jgi:phage gpG-like protein
MINISLGDEWRTLERRLLDTPVKARRRALKAVAKKIRQNSIKRTVSQTDLEGRAFGAYSTKTNHNRPRRRKMLTRLARRMKVVSITDDGAIVGWRNPVEGQIGAQHQFGHKETFSAEGFRRERSENRAEIDRLPATRRQAKALIEAGYKVRRANGRGYQTPSIKWIVDNLKMGQAGFILRVLRGRKELWDVVLPPRSFLGVTDEERIELIDLMINEFHAALNEEEEILRNMD